MGRRKQFLRLNISNIEHKIAVAKAYGDTIGYRSDFLLQFFKEHVDEQRINKLIEEFKQYAEMQEN